MLRVYHPDDACVVRPCAWWPAVLVWAALALLVCSGCPAPSPRPTPAPPGPPIPSDQAEAVVGLVNMRRALPLRVDPALTASAAGHAADMVRRGYFLHISPEGDTFVDRARAAGYPRRPLGEAIAAGQRSAREVVRSWLDSSGHRAILLDPLAEDVGVARSGRYWVLVTGRP